MEQTEIDQIIAYLNEHYILTPRIVDENKSYAFKFIDNVFEATCKYYHTDRATMLSKGPKCGLTNNVTFAEARFIAMGICRSGSNRQITFEAIGERLGRERSAIINGVRRVALLRIYNKDLNADYEIIESMVKNGTVDSYIDL